MGRSNNQLRRTAKAKGFEFIPKKKVRSKAVKLARRQKLDNAKRNRKLSYSKVRTKDGIVKHRKFRPGGYNHSGKLGKAAGAKGLKR
jgi:hypothetical protein